ncbi:MAG: LolA family protein [Brevinematia bacterium]
MRKLLIFFLVFPAVLYSKKIEVTSANTLLEIVKSRIIKTRTFTGSFVCVVNKKTYFGIIKYKAPNKFLFSYYGRTPKGELYETGSKIVSDGKNFWIYLKDQNVAIRESLAREKRTPMIGWNIDRLLKEYVATIPKDGYKFTYQNKTAYKLSFVPKNKMAGFKYINMIFNEDGDILKMEAMNQLDTTIELSLKYESFNINIVDTTFEFFPDENTQIYENILVPEEKKGD